MQYLEKHKDLKHLAWSSLTTFWTVFIVLFSMQVSTLNLDGLQPSDVTSEAVVGAIVTVTRLALIALAQAMQFVILKVSKR